MKPSHIAALIVCAFVLCVIFGVANSWLNAGARTVSADNVQEQWRVVYTDYNALRASARQVCAAQEAVASASAEAAEQRRSQLLAIEANYARIASEYDSAMTDPFRARLIRPHDLPAQAPSLTVMRSEVCGHP